MIPRLQPLSVLVFTACCLLPAARCQEIQRVELPPERVAAEMERVGRSVLTQLPRDQFEELVKKAAAAEAAGKSPPRLVEAIYKATLHENALVGIAEWRVAHGHDLPGRVSLAGVQLALRSARWADDAPAVLAPFDTRPGSPPELLVDRRGERTLKLEWSNRGVPEAGAVRFDLRLPNSLVTTVELELPADHEVQADRDSCVLSGPLPASDSSYRRWRMTLPRSTASGLSVRMTIRRPPATDLPAPLIRASVQTTQKLAPGQVDCEFQFDVQVQRRDVRELTLELDAGLRALDVQGPGLSSWTTGVNRVFVRFVEPFRGGRVMLRGVAPLPPDKPWTSPSARIVGGLSRGERLTLQVDPDLQLDDWRPGAFRPLAAADAGAAQQIVLQSIGIGVDAGSRPTAHIRPVAGAFRTRETWEWRIDPQRTTVTVFAQLIAQRGPVFQSTWQVPPGWQVERVEAEPFDASLAWSVQPGSGGMPALLTVEPRRPFVAAAEPDARRVVIRLRSSELTWSTGQDGAAAHAVLPALTPREAEAREGILTLHVDPALAVPVAGSTVRPDLAVPFRGRPEAAVTLRRRRGRFQARSESEAWLSGDSLRTTYRVKLTPGTGTIQEFFLSASVPTVLRSWRTVGGAVQVRKITPVPIPLAMVGRLWRVSLDRPLATPAEIEITAEPRRIGRIIEPPLLTVVGAERFDGRLIIRSVPGTPWQVTATGLSEEPAANTDDGWARRTFSYGPMPQRVAIDRDRDRAAAFVESATLTIQPTIDGPTYYRLRFAVDGWPKRELPIFMPLEAHPISIHVDGAAVSSMVARPGESGVLAVPWNPAEAIAQVEIVYATEGQPFGGWAELRVVQPTLPMPAALRRVWRLPVGLVPLSRRGWRALPGGATPPWMLSDATRGHVERRQLTLPKAGETLETWLTRVHPKGGDNADVFIIDTAALESAGFGSRTPLTADDLPGVELISEPHAVLVTTHTQLNAWRGTSPRDAAEAVQQAVAYGHDVTGRFRTLGEWRRSANDQPVFAVTDGWTEWEPIGGERAETLWVVRWWVPGVIGLAFASALVAAVSVMRRIRSAAIAIWILAAGLAAIWLPPEMLGVAVPSLVTAATMLIAFALRAWGRMLAAVPEAPSAKSSTTAAALGVMGLLITAVGTSAPPGPTTVYLLANSAGQQDVLAPPELLESLRKAAKQGEPALGAVLREVRYEGMAADAEVRWKATFGAFSFRDAGAFAAVVLPDAHLLGAEVDGRTALPRPAAEAGRFEFELAGRGAHTLVLRFTTPAIGERDRETRFVAPDLPMSSCVVDFPAGAADMVLLSARGARYDIASGSMPRIDADLGRAGLIHFRWTPPNTAPLPRTPAQATHLWEIGEAQARLTSEFRLRFGPASVRKLEFDVPTDLELADVSARNVDDPLAGVNRPADWKHSEIAGRQRHSIEFAAPLSGQVQVELELVPRRPVGGHTELGFPDVVGDFEREVAAAVRLNEVSATVAEAKGWAKMATDDFLHDLWLPLRVEATNHEPELAFRRSRESDAALRLDLKREAAAAVAAQQIHWLVGAGRADLQASATWSEVPGSGPIEWEVPGVISVAEVRGDGVRSWTRSGARLQVWLSPRPAEGPVTLTLSGSMPRPSDEQANAQAPFTVPPMTPAGTIRLRTNLSVQAREGWRIRPQMLGPFTGLPTIDLPGADWSGAAAAPGAAVFALHPARGRSRGNVVTLVESSGRQLMYTVTADIEAAPAAPTDAVVTLLLELRRGAIDRPQLTPAPGMRLRETRSTVQGTTWVLDCRPGRYRVQLNGRAPGTPMQEVVPAISVRGAGETSPVVRRFVTLAPEVRQGTLAGLRPAELPDSRRDLKVWEVAADNWELRVGSAADVATRGQAIADVSATPVDGGRWLIRARFCIFSEADVAAKLPEGADLLSADLDGRALPGDGKRFTLPAAPVVRWFTVIWHTPTQTERPRLELPRLESGGDALPFAGASWTVLAPLHLQIEPSTRPISPAIGAIRRASLLREFMRTVESQVSVQDRAKLGARLGKTLRRADQAMAVSPATAGEPAPDGRTWGEWLKRLHQDAPTDDDRSIVEGPEPFTEAFERGTPTYWFMTNASSPEMRVQPEPSDRSSRAALSIVLVVIVGCGVLITSRRGST